MLANLHARKKFLRLTTIAIIFLIGLVGCQSQQSSLPIANATALASTTALEIVESAATSTQVFVSPQPSQTPAATPTNIGQPTILLFEQFSNEQSCMESFDNQRARAFTSAGEYTMEVLIADIVVNANCETIVVGDFDLEVDATVTNVGEDGSYYFGLIFRVAGEQRYAFVIGNEGGYCAYFAQENNFVAFTNSTDFPVQCWSLIPNSALKQGRQHLRVVAVNDRIDIYLNGELLAVFRDNKLREGRVGFVVATSGSGEVEITFDNLKISRP